MRKFFLILILFVGNMPLEAVPNRQPISEALIKPIDLSGVWMNDAISYQFKHVGNRIIITDLTNSGWDATAIFDGRILCIQYNHIPIAGNYRYITRLELINERLEGFTGDTRNLRFDERGMPQGSFENDVLWRKEG